MAAPPYHLHLFSLYHAAYGCPAHFLYFHWKQRKFSKDFVHANIAIPLRFDYDISIKSHHRFT